MWHWLVRHGLYEAIVSWGVFFVLAGTVGLVVRRAYRRVLHMLRLISEQLTQTKEDIDERPV